MLGNEEWFTEGPLMPTSPSKFSFGEPSQESEPWFDKPMPELDLMWETIVTEKEPPCILNTIEVLDEPEEDIEAAIPWAHDMPQYAIWGDWFAREPKFPFPDANVVLFLHKYRDMFFGQRVMEWGINQGHHLTLYRDLRIPFIGCDLVPDAVAYCMSHFPKWRAYGVFHTCDVTSPNWPFYNFQGRVGLVVDIRTLAYHPKSLIHLTIFRLHDWLKKGAVYLGKFYAEGTTNKFDNLPIRPQILTREDVASIFPPEHWAINLTILSSQREDDGERTVEWFIVAKRI